MLDLTLTLTDQWSLQCGVCYRVLFVTSVIWTQLDQSSALQWSDKTRQTRAWVTPRMREHAVTANDCDNF